MWCENSGLTIRRNAAQSVRILTAVLKIGCDSPAFHSIPFNIPLPRFCNLDSACNFAVVLHFVRFIDRGFCWDGSSRPDLQSTVELTHPLPGAVAKDFVDGVLLSYDCITEIIILVFLPNLYS